MADKRNKMIPTVLNINECPLLLKALASEMNIPDPDNETAQAALDEVDADEDTNGDEQAG